MLTTMDAIAFNLRLTYGVIEMQLIRNVVSHGVSGSLMLLRRERFVPGSAGLHRGVPRYHDRPHRVSVLLVVQAARPGLGDMALIFTYPLMLTVLATVFLGERAGIWRWGRRSAAGVVAVQVALWLAKGGEWALEDSGRPLWLTATMPCCPWRRR